MNYSYREMADIHFCYGLANGVSLRAQRFYGERFPNRRLPDRRMFVSIHRRLSETGRFYVPRRDVGGVPAANALRMADVERIVLQRIRDEPTISTRRLGAELRVPHSTVWRIIHQAGFYPYHFQRVQALYPGDRVQRAAFCDWFMRQRGRQNENFGWNVLFSDESEFTRDGINNFHNQHLWDNVNPHGIIESNHQRRFSCNVWAGIVGSYLLGPVFLPPRLNGQLYHDFLLNELPLLLEEVPINVRRDMWFMHDGAPPHFSRIARHLLSQPRFFGNRWIGRAGPVAWPPRSPDLNPIDFFLWGHCKALVYEQGPLQNVEELRRRIIRAFNEIRNTDGIFHRVNHSMYRRAEACIIANGGHFEQLI